jgi:hypothetical protein
MLETFTIMCYTMGTSRYKPGELRNSREEKYGAFNGYYTIIRGYVLHDDCYTYDTPKGICALWIFVKILTREHITCTT